jgi:hypothetical protein
VLLLVFLAAGVAADPPPDPGTVIRLAVSPQAAPRPALKYQLLPELREVNPGNPVQGYLLCFMGQHQFFFGKDAVESREKWQNLPLKDLPLRELRDYGGAALRQADQAARLDTPDWQILPRMRREGLQLLLPEVQQLRTLASALKVRLRAEVAEKRFGEAVRTLQTLFALSRHLGEHPTVIANLVGLAVASIALDAIDEMLQQPGCPNLYWALTSLPVPLVDLRKGFQGERVLWRSEFPALEESAPMTEAQVQQTVARLRDLQKVLEGWGFAREKPLQWLEARIQDEGQVRAARQRLEEAGLAAALVRKFPAVQAVLLDEKHAYEEGKDAEEKWLTLPYWQAEAAAATEPPARRGEMPFGQTFLTSLKGRASQARLAQRIALLRLVEAIRLYAAAHEGLPPAQLADLTVPAPTDPMTGKPFPYKVEGQTVMIQGTPPRGEAGATFKVRYEVTIKKGGR